MLFIAFNVDLSLLSYSLEVVLRGESVETAQAGDKCDFIGTLIVVPDVSQIQTQGEGCG